MQERLEITIRVFSHFRNVYNATKQRISSSTSSPHSGEVRNEWDFPSSMVFARADAFVARVVQVKVSRIWCAENRYELCDQIPQHPRVSCTAEAEVN